MNENLPHRIDGKRKSTGYFSTKEEVQKILNEKVQEKLKRKKQKRMFLKNSILKGIEKFQTRFLF